MLKSTSRAAPAHSVDPFVTLGATHCGVDPFVTLGAGLYRYVLDIISRQNRLKYYYKGGIVLPP